MPFLLGFYSTYKHCFHVQSGLLSTLISISYIPVFLEIYFFRRCSPGASSSVFVLMIFPLLSFTVTVNSRAFGTFSKISYLPFPFNSQRTFKGCLLYAFNFGV